MICEIGNLKDRCFPQLFCLRTADLNHTTCLFSIHHLTSHLAESIFRAGIMYTSTDGELHQQLKSSMFSLSGTGFFGAVSRSIDLGEFISLFMHLPQLSIHSDVDCIFHLAGGQTALALRLLLAALSSKLSSEVNRPFGDEVIPCQ